MESTAYSLLRQKRKARFSSKETEDLHAHLIIPFVFCLLLFSGEYRNYFRHETVRPDKGRRLFDGVLWMGQWAF